MSGCRSWTDATACPSTAGRLAGSAAVRLWHAARGLPSGPAVRWPPAGGRAHPQAIHACWPALLHSVMLLEQRASSWRRAGMACQLVSYAHALQISFFEFFSDVSAIALHGAVLGWFVGITSPRRFSWLASWRRWYAWATFLGTPPVYSAIRWVISLLLLLAHCRAQGSVADPPLSCFVPLSCPQQRGGFEARPGAPQHLGLALHPAVGCRWAARHQGAGRPWVWASRAGAEGLQSLTPPPVPIASSQPPPRTRPVDRHGGHHQRCGLAYLESGGPPPLAGRGRLRMEPRPSVFLLRRQRAGAAAAARRGFPLAPLIPGWVGCGCSYRCRRCLAACWRCWRRRLASCWPQVQTCGSPLPVQDGVWLSGRKSTTPCPPSPWLWAAASSARGWVYSLTRTACHLSPLLS